MACCLLCPRTLMCFFVSQHGEMSLPVRGEDLKLCLVFSGSSASKRSDPQQVMLDTFQEIVFPVLLQLCLKWEHIHDFTTLPIHFHLRRSMLCHVEAYKGPVVLFIWWGQVWRVGLWIPPAQELFFT